MDFSLPYTAEQEKFRTEVRDWLEENIPTDMRNPVDMRDFSKEQMKILRLRQKQKLVIKLS